MFSYQMSMILLYTMLGVWGGLPPPLNICWLLRSTDILFILFVQGKFELNKKYQAALAIFYLKLSCTVHQMILQYPRNLSLYTVFFSISKWLLHKGSDLHKNEFYFFHRSMF